MATEVVHSLRSTGGDYSSFADWQTAQARDLVLADEIAVLECYDDWPSGLLEQITFSGWTTDPDHPIIIRAAAGHEANGRLPGTAAFSGFYATYDTAATGPFNYTTEHLILEGIGIVKSAGGATPNVLNAGENTRVRRCTIYHQPAVSTSAVVLTGPTSSSGTVFIEALSNCIVYSNTSNDLVRVNSSRTVDSCTLVSLNGAAQAGVYSLNISHNGRVRNTAVFNAAAIYSNGGNDGTNNLLAASGDFVDYAGNDYSIANDSVLAKAGTNPLSPLSNPDDWKDITGKTRAYWDIGAFAAPASLAENTHLATFTTRPTDTGSSGGPNVAGTETNYPGYIDLSEAPQALWDAVAEKVRTWDFDGADGAYTPTGFDTVNGSWEINGNRLRRAGTGLDELLVDVGANDCTITATARCVSGGTNDRASLFFRYGDGDNTWLLYIDEGSNAFTLTKKVSGTWAPSPVKNSTESIALDTDYELKVIISGDTIKCYLDGAYVFETTDSDLSQYTYAGFREASGGLEYANFAASRNDGIVGGDIRVFENQAGGLVELPAEVVSCDTSAETGELHYLLPSISASTPQEIRLYADGVSSRYDHADPFGRNAVWGDYELVMHLGEADGSLSDSTGGGGPYSVTSTGNGTGTAQQTGKMGLGYDFSGGQIVTDTPATGTAAFTMSAWGAFSGARGNEQTIVASWSSSQHVLFRLNPDLTLEGFVDDGSQKGGTFAGSATADTLTHTVMRLDSGTLSGAFNASWSATTFTGIGTLNTGGNDYRIGGRAADPNEFMDGVLDEVRVRHTALSANWITTEYNNQSDPTSFYTATDPNAGGGVSVAVPAASVTITGYAPTVTGAASISVDVPAGEISVTGYAPTVTSTDNIEVAIPADSLTVTGYAPTVTASDSQEVSPGADSISVTGYAPTIAITDAQAIVIPAGSVTVTGYAPTVETTSSVTVEVDTGSVSITGHAPAVGTSISVSPAVSTLSITGYAPSVVASVKTVTCTLVDVNGRALPNLSDLSYAWFDEPDPANLSTPVVKGVTESTDGSGVIEVPISGSSLTSGQTGLLVLRSSDGESLGAYNLPVA